MISVFQSLTWSTAFAWTMPIACIPLSTYLEKEGGGEENPLQIRPASAG